MFSEIIKVPAWNTKAGCCFKCNVKLEDIRDFRSDAAWRLPANRLDHWGFVDRLLRESLNICALFRCPGFRTECIVVDWLHCCDLGVTQNFLGNLFWALLPFQDGNSNAQRVRSLFLKIQYSYKSQDVQNRLDNLTELMIRKKAPQSPKLRASAAEARSLVKFAEQEALASLDEGNPQNLTVRQAAVQMAACYSCLSRETYSQSKLEQHCIAFCLLYKSLEDHANAQGLHLWKVKPKFHMFQELCKLPNNPFDTWCYRDEDFGGYLAHASRRRGGANTVVSTGKNVLNRFKAKFRPLLKQL